MKRIGRMVLLIGLVLAVVVGCGQERPAERNAGEPEVPENMSPWPAERDADVTPEGMINQTPASPEATPLP